MPIQVVCAIMEKKGSLLFCRRSETMAHPLQWEFPGGKVEPQEELHQALRREIMEELHSEVRINKYQGSYIHVYPDKEIQLHAFRCQLIGEPVLSEHREYRWIEKEKIDEFDILEADLKILEQLI